MQGQWKYVTSVARMPEALYDLRRDPREQQNMLQQHKERVRELRKSLLTFESSAERYTAETVEIPATAELIEKLKSLGYAK